MVCKISIKKVNMKKCNFEYKNPRVMWRLLTLYGSFFIYKINLKEGEINLKLWLSNIKMQSNLLLTTIKNIKNWRNFKMEEKLVCYFCEEELGGETVHSLDDRIMCERCFNEQTTTCECCGETIWQDEASGDSNITLCNHCYEYHYSVCENCGRVINNDDAYYDDDSDYPYCYSCYMKAQEKPIKSYNYKPEPIFYGSGSLFMGVELEIDRGGEDDDNARRLLEIANYPDDRLYCKHDGSLNEGFECVSFPMTLEYHIKEMPWEKLMQEALNMGYVSHNCSTCGLHVHVNRSAFGKSVDEQEEVIARIVHFVELHWNELMKFSRRTEDTINRWASRYGISTYVQDTYKNAKDKHLGRYTAVNLENHKTLEFRLFRGTLRHGTFLATLQLVNQMCNCAIRLSDKELETLSWSDFVSNIPKDNAELIEYLKSKRLYVNEATNDETEEI